MVSAKKASRDFSSQKIRLKTFCAACKHNMYGVLLSLKLDFPPSRKIQIMLNKQEYKKYVHNNAKPKD